ncbi:co-chaperone GroES [candidate division TA06 bacterium]|uniref:Co-chaperonin GroES n=1 Tax=candidate division TA06 bacterium TaxID=2250710 RepID=A0A660SHG4_UNCT6|nr:MAG: co-chaperone GroES [candidate division TA06 bacterium]
MKIKPIDDRVLLQSIENEEKKVGNIIIPDTAKEKPQIGKVIAVGNDEDLKKIVKEGDKVIYAKYGGTEIELEGTKYLIVQKSDLLGIVE